MFGYRKDTLPFTKLFLPPQLYGRFREIYLSDEKLRDFIAAHKNPETFPVRISNTIRATRKNILDSINIDYLIPGQQIYPDYPYLQNPKTTNARKKVLKKLKEIFAVSDLADVDHNGKEISTDDAIQLISLVKSSATNRWRDKNIPAILSDLKLRLGDGVTIKFRKAERTAGDENGLLLQGVLAGEEVKQSAAIGKPVLWLIDASFNKKKKVQDWNNDSRFMYPTIVLPQNTELVIFNKS